MIARVPHPDDPDRHLFIALRFDVERNEWVPLVAGESFDTERAAAQACLDHQLKQWRLLHHQGRVLRALCEHPAFNFDDDGVSAATVRTAARTLACQLEILNIELPHMLSAPGAHDQVPLADILVEVEIRTDPAGN